MDPQQQGRDRRYWERHAKRYDASMALLGRPLAPMVERAAEAVQGCGRVLEVAAGTGLVTLGLARTAGSVVATDYAEEMVRHLARRVEAAGLGNVRCERADVYALPYADGAFDAVVAANVLHLVPDLGSALAALRRVLRPGGRLVVPTFLHDETARSWAVSRALALTGFPGQCRFTLASLRAALEGAGLQDVHTQVLPGLIPVGFVDGVFPAAGGAPAAPREGGLEGAS